MAHHGGWEKGQRATSGREKHVQHLILFFDVFWSGGFCSCNVWHLFPVDNKTQHIFY